MENNRNEFNPFDEEIDEDILDWDDEDYDEPEDDEDDDIWGDNGFEDSEDYYRFRL